jgi:hypothetical protein
MPLEGRGVFKFIGIPARPSKPKRKREREERSIHFIQLTVPF